ncbi:hypothetical protein ABWS47_004611 [Salmonella enterica subsp. enterica serovar Chester]
MSEITWTMLLDVKRVKLKQDLWGIGKTGDIFKVFKDSHHRFIRRNNNTGAAFYLIDLIKLYGEDIFDLEYE